LNPSEYHTLYELEENHWWYRSLHRLILRIVSKEYDRLGSLDMLDAGCGTGRLCQLLAPYGTVLGIDIAAEAIELCHKRGLQNVRKADLNTTGLQHEQYDVITSMDVLYHAAVTDEENILKSLHYSLKPGGMLLINLPAFSFLMSSHDKAIHTRRRYRRPELLAMLKNAGFEIKLCSYRLCALFPLLALYRVAKAGLNRDTPDAQSSSDVKPVNPALNCLLASITKLEDLFMSQFPLPFGLSLFAVARKAEHTPTKLDQCQRTL